MNFITPLPITSNATEVLEDLETILQYTSWEPSNQIGITHRKDCADQWKDAIGSLYSKETGKIIGFEKDFNYYNDKVPQRLIDTIEYLKLQIGGKFGRIRFMKLESKTGLSVHRDQEMRYHLALKTNENALFFQRVERNDVKAIGYHIPANNVWHLADTTKFHFVYNGGWESRIHLVLCPYK